ncbi:flagellin N-terminal helical domain-containing protein [Sphingomonas nostoxanthinifaciens]|uniref:flagellin N-terminal helical domain-containing protein n=1 Tax=Sphingomonas nostoxanthinifaciens TaxID=2872652 RepID=UPI001CC1DC1E|nr:flagellin [Sphingomonas nostoxanthinifaciens]UAK26064.1 flagellin-like protein [Sphingomonas nostoxanthinifaciens]
MTSISRYTAQAEISRQSALSSQILTLQQQVSSGKRLAAPSDDPAASARVSEIRQMQADQVVYTTNTNTGAAISSAADTALTSVTTLLTKAKELMLSGRNDATSDTDRATIAGQLTSLLSNIQSLSTQNDPTGAPLFPDGTPLELPVSDTLNLPATASRDSVFNQVSIAGVPTSITSILTDAATALTTTDATQRATLSDASLTALDDAINHITQVQADQGVRAQRFDTAKTALADAGDALTTERSSLEDTDLTYALSQFQSKQLSLQAAQSVYAQTMKKSLFDLIG